MNLQIEWNTTRVKIHPASLWFIGAACALLVFGFARSGPDADPEASPLISLSKSWGPGKVREPSDPHYRDWRRVETDGRGHPDFMAAPVDAHPPFQDFISFDIRLNKLAHFSGIELRLGDRRFENYYAFAIPFYADPPFNIIQDGHWQRYTFGPSHASTVGTPHKGPLEYLGVYLQDNQRGPLIVDIANLRFLRPALDRGIVSITFDDGYDDHFWAATIMHAYGLRGTAYVMPRQIGQPGYLTLEQLKQMQTEYGWGISAHHQTPLTDFPPAQLDAELKYTVDYLNRQGFSESAGHIAYPLGRQNREAVLRAVSQYFKTARLAGGGAETFPPADRYLIRAYNVHRALAPAKVALDIQKAVNAGQWIILMFHYLVEDPTNDYGYARDAFEEVVRHVADLDLTVMPMHEAAATIWPKPPQAATSASRAE